MGLNLWDFNPKKGYFKYVTYTKIVNHSDEGLKLKTSVFKSFYGG